MKKEWPALVFYLNECINRVIGLETLLHVCIKLWAFAT